VPSVVSEKGKSAKIECGGKYSERGKFSWKGDTCKSVQSTKGVGGHVLQRRDDVGENVH